MRVTVTAQERLARFYVAGICFRICLSVNDALRGVLLTLQPKPLTTRY